LSEKRWDFVKETETHGGSHRIDDLLRSKEKLSSNYTNTRQPVPAFSLPHGPGARSVSTGDFTFFDLPLVLGPPTRPSFILFGRNHLSSLKLGPGLGRDACGNDEASFRLSMRKKQKGQQIVGASVKACILKWEGWRHLVYFCCRIWELKELVRHNLSSSSWLSSQENVIGSVRWRHLIMNTVQIFILMIKIYVWDDA
jgi:hypothetical protein